MHAWEYRNGGRILEYKEIFGIVLCVGFSLRYDSNNQGNVYSAADVVGVV